MFGRIFLIASLAFSFAVSAQLQNKKWHQFPAAGGFGASVTDRTSAINILENGKIYFTYHDQNSSLLTIHRFDLINNQWDQIQSITLSGVNVSFVNTFAAGNRLYISWASYVSGTEVSVVQLDEDEQLQFLVNNAPSSMDVFNNNSYNFTVDEIDNLVYTIVKGFNSDVFVDRYSLTSGAFQDGTYVGYLSGGQPKIALDYDNSLIYVVGTDFSAQLILHSSPFGTTLNFTPVGGPNGYVYSSLYQDEGVSYEFDLVEKASNSPELIFTHENATFGELFNIRLGLGSNTNSDISIANPNLLFGVSGSARGNNSFIFGANSTSFEMYVEEIFPNGSIEKVGLNQNPIISFSDGEAYKLSHNNVNNRLGVFYHYPDGNGLDGGMVAFTNTPPELVSLDNLVGCAGGFSVFIKNILFTDAEDDEVVILNTFESTDINVIDPNTLFAFESSNDGWIIDGSGGNTGFTDLTFYFTDGLDTVSETVTVEVVAPEVPNFLSADISLCISEGEVDFNEYVDIQGGEFSFDEMFQLEEGILDLSLFDNTGNLPFLSYIDYVYHDANGCISYNSADVTILDIPSASLAITNSACGANSGEIEATVTSPNGSYISYWNTGDQNSLTISDLNPGSYYLNIFDNEGCIGVAQGTVEAADITVTAQINQVSCHNGIDGSIELSISGPGAPYDVFWSTGASISSIQNLTSGIYEAVITDVNGCQVTYSYKLNNPDKMELELFASPPSSCSSNDGSIESFVMNGVGNISYQWSTGASSMDLFGLPAGVFSLIATDENGCSVSGTTYLTSYEGIGAYGNVQKANCGEGNGSIVVELYPAFGQTVSSLEWTNGETTPNIYNLLPGYYELKATQSDGCVSVFGWEVESFNPPKPAICMVTVDSVTTTNLIVWEKPVTSSIDHYRIYRETSSAGQYILIDTVHYSNISVFNDVVASPKTKSWRYKISSVNQCGKESPLSSSHKTIHLVTQDLGGGEYKVSWDNYEGFPFNEYDLYRYTNATGWELILEGIPFLALPYTFDTPPSIDGLDYMIEIDPGFQCTATFGKAQDYNSSRSNKARGEFNPGSGTGDPNNSLVEFEGESMSVSIYPNPSSGQFNVDVSFQNMNSQADLLITDISGKTILQQNVFNGLNSINLEHVNAGIYLVTIRDARNNIVVRIVKN